MSWSGSSSSISKGVGSSGDSLFLDGSVKTRGWWRGILLGWKFPGPLFLGPSGGEGASSLLQMNSNGSRTLMIVDLISMGIFLPDLPPSGTTTTEDWEEMGKRSLSFGENIGMFCWRFICTLLGMTGSGARRGNKAWDKRLAGLKGAPG